MFSFLFSTKVNSIFLYPTDEPFKLPEPFNNNLGAFASGYYIAYVIVLHYNHCFSIDIVQSKLVLLGYMTPHHLYSFSIL